MNKIFKTFLAVFAFVTVASLMSCTKTCDPGYEGTKCDVKIVTKYTGNYQVNGTDNQGGTYTNWTCVISESSSDVLTVLINLQNASITLSAKVAEDGGSYTISSQNVSGFTYSGSGTLTSNAMTLSLTEIGGTPQVTTVYTFTGSKQ